MKKILLTINLMIIALVGYSQYYYVPYLNAGKNPGALNKTTEEPAAASPITTNGWSSIWSGPASSSVAYSSNQNIPFAFKFNGTAVTSFKASNFGVVTFDVTSTKKPANYTVLSFPSNSIPDKSVYISGIKPISNGTYQSQIITKTFGTAPNRQFWIQFAFFSEANIQSGWTYWAVVLEETTDKIHIVDMKTLCVTSAGQLCNSNVKVAAGVQIDSTTATSISGSPNLGAMQITQNIFDATDNSYYTFSNGSQPANNAEGIASSIPDYLALTQAPFNLKGDFKNIGSSSITSCDINYSINNGAPVTVAVPSISLAKNATSNLTHSTQWTPSATGTYKITMWLSNINGATDGEGYNDSITKNVIVVEDYAVRIPLHEVFTSSTCGPCRPGNQNIDENIFPTIPGEYTCIKYQMSWPGTGDPYTTSEGNVRRSLYGVNSIPNMQVDGGWNGNAGSYTTALFNNFKAKPSFIKLSANFNLYPGNIKVITKYTPYVNYNNSNLRLFVALLEKRTIKNLKSNGETEFFHVLKKMLPDANGVAIGNVTKNVEKLALSEYYVKGSYRLPSDGQNANIINLATENTIEDINNLEVVVFIQDIVTKEVYQSANGTFSTTGIDGINKIESGITIFPNPSTAGLTNVSFNLNTSSKVKVNVYNNLGQIVNTIATDLLNSGLNTININTEALAKGLYTVKIEGDNYSKSAKLIVE